VVFYSWADVIGYDSFLSDIADPSLREETRQKTVALFRLLEGATCRHRAVCAYFDETIAPCGVACDVCLGIRVEFANAPAVARVAARSSPQTVTFERLRALRRKFADAENVPAYIVFSDAVLREMAERKPQSEAELLRIPGIGSRKLARYGKAFLEALRGE
jgi:superfamily II DNA helicase RecQ